MQRATSGAHAQFGSNQKINWLYDARSGYNAIYNHLRLGDYKCIISAGMSNDVNSSACMMYTIYLYVVTC